MSNYERDPTQFDEKGCCPYCGGIHFSSEAVEVSVGEYLNECLSCDRLSIWFENKQYKLME